MLIIQLMCTCEENRDNIIVLCLRCVISCIHRHWMSGMDMTLSDYDGRTALHLSAAEGHIGCVEFLLQQCKVPHDPRDR